MSDLKQQLQDLWEEEKLPQDFMSSDGSLRSSSKNSSEALVLKEASSCWADVPAGGERKRSAVRKEALEGTGGPDGAAGLRAPTCRQVDGVVLGGTPALDGCAVDLFEFHPRNKTHGSVRKI